MKRFVTVSVLFCLFATLVSTALAQDEVRYYDRATKKEALLKGPIQSESPSSLEVKTAMGLKEVSAVDIIDVRYQLPALVTPNYRKAENKVNDSMTLPTPEFRKKALGDAVTLFKDLIPEAKDEKIKRHFEFKLAKLMVRQADDDDALTEAAMDKLIKFKKEHTGGWQISHAVKLLVKMQMDKQDFEAAQKSAAELAALPGLSKDLKRDADISLAQVMTGAKKFTEAEKKLQDLSKGLAPDDPQAPRIQMAMAQCMAGNGKLDQAEPLLQAIISNATDNDLKAQAYNTLGECLMAGKKSEDALWAFLWVDVMYHQNRQEHARALYHLYKLFKERQDDAKAKACREKLEKDKQFAGLEYQRKIQTEK